MGFVAKRGVGFFAGNAFVRSAMKGTKAFMANPKVAQQAIIPNILTPLSDWIPIAGSPDGVLSKPAGRIRISADGGVMDGIKTSGTYHFDPTKWYRVTVHMEIDVAGDGLDHDGGQFSVEMKPHNFDHVDATLGWGIAGGVLPVSPPIQTITIHPHTAETEAHFRILGMGVAGDPMEIVSIVIEEFDSDPDAVSPTVVSSDIPADHPEHIEVMWDKPMVATGHLVDEIDVIIGTAAPIHPTRITFHANKMTMVFHDHFAPAAKVTWAYDDSNPHVQLHAVDGLEAENQTYVVANHAVIQPPAVPPTVIGKPSSIWGVHVGYKIHLDGNTYIDLHGVPSVWSLTGAPSWLHIDPATGIITGTTRRLFPSTSVGIVATNSGGSAKTQPFDLSVDPG